MSNDSIIRILIASDIHAGYGENKSHIANDTFVTLDEVLKKAEEKKVHFILMAGDLFHENHPTRQTHLKVVRSLRKYCLGESKPDINFLSDPAINFQHSQFGSVNYLDPNLKVSMPIFTIHGNHDDLSGKGLTALDVLHEEGLVNLFGKFSDVDEIQVAPLLLTRGNTKIAIYGIGSQRDDRLARAFSKGRVKFIRPEEEPQSWFSILVLHQNRPPRSKIRSTKAHVSFKSIPSWFDLVIWGHEHECRIEPEIKYPNPADDDRSKSFYIIQPGSTVATSLTTEEAAQKHIGVLHIREKEFKLTKIELETPRQILIDELILADSEPSIKIARSTVRQEKNMPDERLIVEHIEMMLRNAEEKRKLNQPQPPRVRLKIVYSGKWLDIPPINARKFGAKYADRVANPTEMIFVRVLKEENNKAKNVSENLNQVLGVRFDDVCSVEEMVNKYFTKCEFPNRLNVLSEIAMGKQLQEYTNTELNTQYKYTAADKSMTENIKLQIGDLTAKVNEVVNSRLDQDTNEDSMEQQIVNAIFMAKRERLNLNKTNMTTTTTGDESCTMNETADTLFHERGYDPTNMVTSTPRASQERELLWSESIQHANGGGGQTSDESQQGGMRMEDDVTEFDFSPSP